MAKQLTLQNLKKVADEFRAVDQEKLLRPSMGEESLQLDFGPRLTQLNKRLDFALEFAPSVNDSIVAQVASVFDQFRLRMDEQAKRTNIEYVAKRIEFLANIDSYFEQLLQYWPPFVTAAIEMRGFLQDEGIQKEYHRTIEAMQEKSEAALKLVKEESDKAIEEARKLAQQIEEQARQTATRISVKAAQDQFKEAQKDHNKQVKIWSWLSSLSIIVFLGVAIYLMQVQFPEEWKWHIIYYTAIRITILTAIGAIATFCLRILRAHMHMRQHNLHRQRVANSMAAFVESAVTREQRDLILSQLVDAVVAFGTSGLLQKEDDSIHSPKMTIDTITRTLLPPSQKS